MGAWKKKWEHLLTRLERHGVLNVLGAQVLSGLNRLTGYDPYECFVMAFDQRPSGTGALPSGFHFREISFAELDQYAGDSENDLSGEFLSKLRPSIDRCYGYFIETRLAGYAFVASMPTEMTPHLRFHFRNDWRYLYKVYTFPQWRGQGHVGKLLAAVMNSYPEADGIQGFVALVSRSNLASLKAFERLGFKSRRLVGVASDSLFRIEKISTENQ